MAQSIALIPLLYSLHQRVGIDIIGNFKQLTQSLKKYLEAGGYVLFRTIGKVLAYSVCAREAVRFVDCICIYYFTRVIYFGVCIDEKRLFYLYC